MFSFVRLVHSNLRLVFRRVWIVRARNNGRSTDNVRTDCGFDRSNFRLAGHVDRSKFSRIENEINSRFLLISCFICYLSSRCVLQNFNMKSWSHGTRAVIYNSRIETSGFVHFRSENYQIFPTFWVYGPLKELFMIYIWPGRNDTWPSKNEFGRSSWPETIRKLFRALIVKGEPYEEFHRSMCVISEKAIRPKWKIRSHF